MSIIYSQNGPVNVHIKESFGGSNSTFNHYSTTYNLHYEKHCDLYKDCLSGGNFMWSKRCSIGYHSGLDKHDNPLLRPKLLNNYLSVTKRDFRYPRRRNEDNSLWQVNKLIVPQSYSFHTELSIPKNMHDRNSWTTVYSKEFNEKVPNPIDFHRDPIGKKEDSGFTLNNPIINTIDALPHSVHRNDRPGTETNRPTGNTVYSTDFRSYQIPDGSEPLPGITFGSDKSSGFVKGNQPRPDFIPLKKEINNYKTYTPKELAELKRRDPCEYLDAVSPKSEPSITKGTYIDPFSQGPNEEEILNRVKVGDKERTGFVANQINYIQSKDNPQRFITHNMTKYYDPTLIDFERNGHVSYNVNNILLDGFVKNNGVQNYVSHVNSFNESLDMDNYQQRSFDKRDYVAR